MTGPDALRYTTVAAVIDILAPDGDEDGTPASMDTAIIVSEIAAAEDRIDAALATRYTLPLNPVPVVLADIARDLAVYRCDLRYRGQNVYTQGSPIMQRRSDAEGLLTQLVNGQATLAQPDPVSSGRGAGRARNTYGGRLFDPADPYLDQGAPLGGGPTSRWDLDHYTSGW